MQIRELHPLDDPRDLATVVEVYQRFQSDFLPGFPEFGEARLRYWCTPRYQHAGAVFAAFADENAVRAEAVGLFGYQLKSNLNLTYINLGFGAGESTHDAKTAIFEEATRRTSELGRTRLGLDMPGPTDPAPFAEQHGGKYTDTALSSVLDLHAIDRAQYEEWAEPSAKNSEYTLVSWSGSCPDELAESYCTALDAMADQPMGDFEYEFTKVEIERLRFTEEQAARHGRNFVQVALDPEGNIAGFNSLMSFPDEPGHAEIWDTGVIRAHRGHGLGLRLKAAASLRLLEEWPSARWVRTFNNEENEWMLRVNRTLGYTDFMPWRGYEFAVAG